MGVARSFRRRGRKEGCRRISPRKGISKFGGQSYEKGGIANPATLPLATPLFSLALAFNRWASRLYLYHLPGLNLPTAYGWITQTFMSGTFISTLMEMHQRTPFGTLTTPITWQAVCMVDFSIILLYMGVLLVYFPDTIRLLVDCLHCQDCLSFKC